MRDEWYDGVAVPASDLEAFRRYQGWGYRAINGEMRAGGLARESSAIDRLFETLPTTAEPVVVYRGARASDRLRTRLARDVIRDGGYVSTSLDEAEALSFATVGGALFEIGLPVGTPCISSAHLARSSDVDPVEQELLLPRGTGFRIIERDLRWFDDGIIDVLRCEPIVGLGISSRRSRSSPRTSRARSRESRS